MISGNTGKELAADRMRSPAKDRRGSRRVMPEKGLPHGACRCSGPHPWDPQTLRIGSGGMLRPRSDSFKVCLSGDPPAEASSSRPPRKAPSRAGPTARITNGAGRGRSSPSRPGRWSACPSVRRFPRSQAAIARETREIPRAGLSRNRTAREFAQRFQVSETSLKNYFRGVFGGNLSRFLREEGMRRAAELPRDAELRVAGIAAQVGHENQSKFSAVLAGQFGCPPLESRRRARLL